MLLVLLLGPPGIDAAVPSCAGQASVADEFRARLEALTPERPGEYLELGEELADVAKQPKDLALAQQLMALSFVLASAEVEHQRLRPVACLALAATERSPERQQLLRAVATRLDRRYAPTRWNPAHRDTVPALTRLKLAEFLGLVRSGDGALARQRFEHPGVEQLADQLTDLRTEHHQPLGVTRLRSEAQIWPCPQCGNARVVPDPARPRDGKRFCPTCRANPGPPLNQAELTAEIAREAAVLDAGTQTWSAEHAVGHTRPLIDPDPAEVATLYGVDAAQPFYRDDRWVTAP